ncbi:MAG: FtsH protease activity modulator HflK [Rhodospirillales bacterium]|nr:FtsH protease activity modulator HflK [Rhodospirillales bacterium]
MAWNPQGGGQGPWGGGSSTPQPPDIEELLRSTQEKMKRFMPGGVGSSRGIALAIVAALALWLASGFYRVEPGEQGVTLLFGKLYNVTNPGLNYFLPAPIGEVLTPNVDRTNVINIGFRDSGAGGRGSSGSDVPQESLMLTGDQNIIDIDFVVQWRIKSASDYLFNIRNPDATIKLAAESAIREVIGQTSLEPALTVKRQEVEQKTKDLLQSILDSYGSGVFIAEVKQQKVDPPGAVIDAFNDVQRARQDKERKQNEAQAYRNRIVPTARGEAEVMIQGAAAYKGKIVKEAEGEAGRFMSVYEAYRGNKEVTSLRLYLERMQEVLSKSEKVIIDRDSGSASGVVPYLPLPEIKKRSGGAK